ncbi:MAG: D-alanine--D-alanine ligase [Chloroflexi bacterium]|nr:D-alanine--D-alanine ligase [Chloroflexota bacterium]
MARLRVGVLFGGRSGEHEVSMNSARTIIAALNPEKFEAVPIGITRDGAWIASGDPFALLEADVAARQLADAQARSTAGAVVAGNEDLSACGGNPSDTSSLLPVLAGGAATGDGERALMEPFANWLSRESRLDLDVVFPILHGPFGEDGTVQGLLDLAGVPYVGSGVLASAVGMDKVLMKAVFAQHGLAQTDYQVVFRRAWEWNRERILDEVVDRFRYPIFAKPANLGSSVGVSKARTRDELAAAIDKAARYDRKVLVEQGVDAREIEVGVLGYDDPIASALGEVRPRREFYDYVAKYFNDASEFIIPAELPDVLTRQIQRLAIAAFKAIDAAGMARVDFFVERATGRVLVNEINTIPGFTRLSLYPKLWQASGLSCAELVDRLIHLALERHADRQRNQTSFEELAA